jgi:LytS/YehU family sensor histidine kinase
MDESCKFPASQPGASFFTVAAWYCLIVPFLAPVLAFCIFVASGFGRFDIALIAALCCAVSSFIVGIVSLFGIQRHGVRRILWKALIGIAASAILGFFAFAYLDMLKTWHG